MTTAHPVDYGDVLEPTFVRYLEQEGRATRLRSFQPTVIPGLLQTRRYAEALMKDLTPSWFHEPDKATRLERQLEARMARQSILERDDVKLHFIVEEAALRRRFWQEDGSAILHQQLEWIRELPMHPHQLFIQYLPFSRAVFEAMDAGPFTLLDVDGNKWLYQERPGGQSTLTDNPDQIEFYDTMFLDLAVFAVDLNGDHVYGQQR